MYGIPRTTMDTAVVPIRRAMLRLYELEQYLKPLRDPAKPSKQVRSASKKQPKARGKSKTGKFSHRGVDRFHQQLVDSME